MDTKLTLSMDKKVIEKAKKYAAKENTSLSNLIEGFLIRITGNEVKKELPPLVNSLSGILKGKISDGWKEDKMKHLESKYSK